MLKLPSEIFYEVIEWCLTAANQIVRRGVSSNYVKDSRSKKSITRIYIICKTKFLNEFIETKLKTRTNFMRYYPHKGKQGFCFPYHFVISSFIVRNF